MAISRSKENVEDLRDVAGNTNQAHTHANKNLLDTITAGMFEALTPVGTVITIAGVNVPTGYLECDGSIVSRTVEADLFAQIGVVYGAGDGSTTFLLPDLRGRFVRGWDHGVGRDISRVFGTFQGDAIRNITGIIGPVIRSQTGIFTATGPFSSEGITTDSGTGASTVGVNVTFNASAVVPTGNDNRPTNIAMMYCIKT